MHVASLLQFLTELLFIFHSKLKKKTSYSNEWLLKFVKWLSISYSKQSPNNLLCWLRFVQMFIFIYFRQAQELANRNSTQVENLAVSIVMIQVLKNDEMI